MKRDLEMVSIDVFCMLELPQFVDKFGGIHLAHENEMNLSFLKSSDHIFDLF